MLEHNKTLERDKLAETLRQYVSGRVTNDTLDDLKTNNEDYGVKAIKDAAWFLYDDLYEHKAVGKNRIEKDNRHEVSKWIVFLQSDEEYLWPFFTNESLESALKKPKLFSGKRS